MKLRLFCFLACLYLLVGSREPPWADAKVMYETAVSMVDRHSLELKIDAPPFFFSIHNGKKYGLYPMGNTLAIRSSMAKRFEEAAEAAARAWSVAPTNNA